MPTQPTTTLTKKTPIFAIILSALFIILIIFSGIFIFSRKTSPNNQGQTSQSQNTNNPLPEQQATSFTDPRDGHTYKTIKIGDQIWLAENLAYKPEDGFSIYENDSANVPIYGYLYTWQTAQTIAPDGWHLPSKEEWETLNKYLDHNVAGKLKETGFDHWKSPNTNATNESNFTALPAGGNFDGSFIALGRTGFWWSSTAINETNAYGLVVDYNSSGISWYSGTKTRGLSVRLIKD